MNRFFLILLLTSPFAAALNFTNKAGVSFDGTLVEISKTANGQPSVIVKRNLDGRKFSIPLSTLNETTLISIIQDISTRNHRAANNQNEPRPVAAAQNRVLQNKQWSDFDNHKIIDFRTDPNRWHNKTVTLVGNFQYKASFGESFSIEQGDEDIDIVYSNLSKREKEEIFKRENFSDDLVKVSGRIEKHSFSDNSFDIIAKKVEFLD